MVCAQSNRVADKAAHIAEEQRKLVALMYEAEAAEAASPSASIGGGSRRSTLRSSSSSLASGEHTRIFDRNRQCVGLCIDRYLCT